MLTVTGSLTLGRLRYDTHAIALTLRLGVLPAVDRLEATLPRGLRLEAEPGEPAILELDGGEGGEVVFTGTTSSLRRGEHGVTVTAHGAAAALAGYRPSLSLEQIDVGDIVRRLCADVEVDVDSVVGGTTLARYVARAQSTALDEIARLSRLVSATTTISASGALRQSHERPAAELGIRYGRELISATAASPAESPGGTSARVVVGEGAAAPGSPRALWTIADFWAGGAPAPGPSARRRVAYELRSTADAAAAARGWSAAAAGDAAPVRLRCWLLPKVVPDALLQIEDASDDLGLAKVRVRQVVHRVDPILGAVTDIRGFDAGAALPGGLVGALGGAVTGGLGGLR